MGEISYRILRVWYGLKDKLKNIPTIFISWKGAEFYIALFLLIVLWIIVLIIIRDSINLLILVVSLVVLFIISIITKIKIPFKRKKPKKKFRRIK